MQVVDAVCVAPEALAGGSAAQPHRRHLAPAAVCLDRPPGRCRHMLQTCALIPFLTEPLLLPVKGSSICRLWPYLHALYAHLVAIEDP